MADKVSRSANIERMRPRFWQYGVVFHVGSDSIDLTLEHQAHAHLV